MNEALAATAQALDGLGERFGQSITDANENLDDLNQRMPQIRDDTQKLADLAGVYADASPDLWAALQNAVVTARDAQRTAAQPGRGADGFDRYQQHRPRMSSSVAVRT